MSHLYDLGSFVPVTVFSNFTILATLEYIQDVLYVPYRCTVIEEKRCAVNRFALITVVVLTKNLMSVIKLLVTTYI